MACTSYTLSGLNTGCKDSIGGIREVWVANFDDLKYTVTQNVVTPSAVGTKEVEEEEVAKELADVLHPYKFRRNTGSMTSTLNVSENAGSSFTTEVVLQFLKQETTKRLEILGLCLNETRMIVKDGNGKYWALGFDFPIEASAGTAETGTAATDFNGYNLTLSDNSILLPYEITDPEIIAEIEAIVVA